MAKIERFSEQVIYKPQTQAQGFVRPTAPDLISPLRQNQQAMAQEQKSIANANQLEFKRQAEILKANKLVEDLGAANLLALTTGGRKLLEAGVEQFGQMQEENAVSMFINDVEARKEAAANYQTEQGEFSVLDNEAEKLALESARNAAPPEVVSSYNQLWGRGRRAYEEQAAKYYGDAERFTEYFNEKMQSDDRIQLPDGTEFALNEVDSNTKYAAARSYIKDLYMQENGLVPLINRNPGLYAEKFLPGIDKADRKLASKFEKELADNDGLNVRASELNSLVDNFRTDPFALSHYLNQVSTTTKDGKRLGMRGAWNQLETDLLQVASTGKDISVMVSSLKKMPMPNDPKGRTYGELHGTKLDVIIKKAFDEDRKNFRRDMDFAQMQVKKHETALIAPLLEKEDGVTKEEILAAKEAFIAVNAQYQIHDPDTRAFDRLLTNPSINGDLEREQIIIQSHEDLAKIGLLTVDEVQRYPGIKNYNYYLQKAQQQEKAYNQAGGLKETLKAVEQEIKSNPSIKTYGRFGELGGVASMMVMDFKRRVQNRVQELMLSKDMTVQRANHQAFQEFRVEYKAAMANKDSQYFYSNKRGKGERGFINYGKDVSANRAAYNASIAKINDAQKANPKGFLKQEGLFGDREFWTDAMEGFGQPGWRPDAYIVRMARQLGVPVLDIYKNQLENYKDLPQPIQFEQILKGDQQVDPDLKRFYNNYVEGVSSRMQFSRFSGRPSMRPMFASVGGNDQLSRLKRAFISQESGGDHNAVNSRTGALGLVQVMPENVGSFTQRYLGRAMTYAEFKNNRAAQELLAERHFEALLVKHSAPGRSEEETIRRIAAEHYGGPGAVEYWNSTGYHAAGSRYNPYGNEPNMAEYTMSVFRKYKGGF